MSETTIACAGQDEEAGAAQLRRALVQHNVLVIGAGLAAGLPVELASLMAMPLEDRKPAPPKERVLTAADEARIAAAEAKRQRRASLRAAQSGGRPVSGM